MANLAAIIADVKTNLADSRVDVELESADYTRVVTAAVRELNRIRPQRAWSVLPFAGGTQQYLIPPPAFGITDVQTVGGEADCGCVVGIVTPFPLSEGDAGYYGPSGALFQQLPGDVAGDWVQMLNAATAEASVRNNAPDWTTRKVAGSLYLYVRALNGAKVAYEYLWRITVDDTATGVTNIAEGDLEWVVRFATAKAKQILGLVRRKHGGINLPGGGTESLDGPELVGEGKEEEAALMEELKQRRRPLLPQIG